LEQENNNLLAAVSKLEKDIEDKCTELDKYKIENDGILSKLSVLEAAFDSMSNFSFVKDDILLFSFPISDFNLTMISSFTIIFCLSFIISFDKIWTVVDNFSNSFSTTSLLSANFDKQENDELRSNVSGLNDKLSQNIEELTTLTKERDELLSSISGQKDVISSFTIIFCLSFIISFDKIWTVVDNFSNSFSTTSLLSANFDCNLISSCSEDKLDIRSSFSS
jgi:regulator of replication initiation timing